MFVFMLLQTNKSHYLAPKNMQNFWALQALQERYGSIEPSDLHLIASICKQNGKNAVLFPYLQNKVKPPRFKE